MHVTTVRQLEPTDSLLAIQTQGSSTSGVVGSSTTADISNFASTLSNLQQLQQNDPSQFGQVMANAASLLGSISTGSPEGQLFSQLVGQFQGATQDNEAVPEEAGPSSNGQGSSATTGSVHRGVQTYAAQQARIASDAAQQSESSLAQIVQGAIQQVGG